MFGYVAKHAAPVPGSLTPRDATLAELQEFLFRMNPDDYEATLRAAITHYINAEILNARFSDWLQGERDERAYRAARAIGG